MAFTFKSKEELTQIGLDAISDDFDKSENSFIHQAISAIAVIAHENEIRIEHVYHLQFLETVEGEDLDRYVFDRSGIERKKAIKAYGKVTFYGIDDTYIPQHFKVGNDSEIFETVYGDVIHQGSVTIDVEAVIEGNRGDFPRGTITNKIDELFGLDSVTNMELIKAGSNAESDVFLRARYRDHMQDAPTSNNPAHFRKWAREVRGVGQVRVQRAFKGEGTVQLIVLDDNFLAASPEILQKVRENVQEKMAFDVRELSVIAPEVVKLNIQLDAKLFEGYLSTNVYQKIKEAIKKYLATYPDPNYIRRFVSYWDIAVLIKSVEGIEDITLLKINGSQENIQLTELQVAEVGEIT